MNDQELRLTPTHAADEFHGSVFGISTVLFAWVGMAFLAGLALFCGLFYGLGYDFLDAAKWAVLPGFAVVAYLRLLHQGKPPGFTFELLDSLVTGGHAVPPRKVIKHPLHDV